MCIVYRMTICTYVSIEVEAEEATNYQIWGMGVKYGHTCLEKNCVIYGVIVKIGGQASALSAPLVQPPLEVTY